MTIQEVLAKTFYQNEEVLNARKSVTATEQEWFDAIEDLQAAHIEELDTRNRAYFEEEAEKLDRWAEDMKLTLENELREIDASIRAARQASKTCVSLAEKLDAQRAIKTLEHKRGEKRRQLFDAQDEVDRKRADLIDEMETQLKASVRSESLFSCRWVLT